jgi:ABC-2 type transport system permease protein
MNIINKAFLKLALLPAPVYKKMGADLKQLRSILNIKLTMDDRRVATLQQTSQRKSKKPVTRATLLTMFLSALMGLVLLFAFTAGADRLTHLTFYFAFFFFMLASTLISDFTSVLIDPRDTFIILPKPVSDKTFLIARLLHIFIHICKIVLPLTIPGLIFIGVNDGILGSLILLIDVLLVTLFTIFVINALYILILKITTPERFKTIISYFQIIFAISIYASYQLVPRLIDKYDLENFSFTEHSYIIYLPFYWFAASWQLLYSFHATTTQLIAAILGLIVPVFSIYAVVKFLAPSFNNKLAMINSSGGSEKSKAPAPGNFSEVGKTQTSNRIAGYSYFLSRFFTKTRAEKMGFQFTWKLMDRSRDFKLKVYPGIGYILVYIFIMFYGKGFQLEDFAEETSKGKIAIISSIYFTSFILTMAINQMVFSEKYKASWIYYAMPLVKPGDVILGGVKAAIFKFYIPLLTIIVAACLILIGPSIIPNLILGMFNVLLIATLQVYAGNKLFAFSMQQSANVKTGSFLRSMFIFFVSGTIAVGHYFLYGFIWVIIGGAILSVLATWLLMSGIRNTGWTEIRSGYNAE